MHIYIYPSHSPTIHQQGFLTKNLIHRDVVIFWELTQGQPHLVPLIPVGVAAKGLENHHAING